VAAKDFPKTVRYETGSVRISRRADGRYAMSWREAGARQRTTIAGEKEALAWAGTKARELDAAGGRRWISQAEAEQLAELHRVAGQDPAGIRALLVDVAAARKILAGGASLAQAAQWMADHGPLRIQRAMVHATIKRFLADYLHAPAATRRTMQTEMLAYVSARVDSPLMELDEAALRSWCARPLEDGSAAAPRTVKNRITQWLTFLNRAQAWKLLPPGPTAAAALKRPRLADAGREILTVEQGGKLLAAVREKEPRLEPYLLIAGWLGCRPSEVQRLRWGALESSPGYLHVTAAVAGKTSQERFIPVEPRLAARLAALRAELGKTAEQLVCPFRAREYLSVLARRGGIVAEWPADVLRHSFCSYRLAATQDRARVAEEAGNSPAIIAKHYRRPLPEAAGAQWWDLLGPPDPPQEPQPSGGAAGSGSGRGP
jgi:integrase